MIILNVDGKDYECYIVPDEKSGVLYGYVLLENAGLVHVKDYTRSKVKHKLIYEIREERKKVRNTQRKKAAERKRKCLTEQ